MGTDIHVVVEKRNKDSGEWEALNLYRNTDDGYKACPVYDGRDYELFGLLAGVRGASSFLRWPIGYLVAPRGMPDDISSYAKEYWNDGEYFHTPTWYDYCELEMASYLLSEHNKAIKCKNRETNNVKRRLKELEAKDNDEYDEDDCWCEENEDEPNVIDRFANFVGDIDRVLSAYSVWFPRPNEIRILIWFDS